MTPVIRHFALGIFAIFLTSAVSASELADLLNRELAGGWGVLEVEIYSNCGGTYSDNTVGSVGVTSKAGNRFSEGELVKIDKVKVKRQRVDLLLTIAVPLRRARMDGPFELYDNLECRTQLIFPVGREQVKTADAEAILTHLRERLTVFRSLAEAQESDAWNGRELDPLPPDYDTTLQRHAAWKAEQTNTAVRVVIDRALEAAADIADDLSDDTDYLAGFAEGAEEMSSFASTECSSLLSASYTVHRTKAPKDRDKRWREGYDDGQELVFNVLVADRLRSCTVPVPLVSTP
jgi:hypothetical protein